MEDSLSTINSRDERQLNRVFAALADPTRRAILNQLAQSEASVSELTEPYGISQAAISKHLKKLEEAGLVDRYQKHQKRIARLNAKPMNIAIEYIGYYQKFWDQNFNGLDQLVNNLNQNQEGNTK